MDKQLENLDIDEQQSEFSFSIAGDSNKIAEKVNKLEVELLLMKKEMEMVKLASKAESNEIGRNLSDKIFTMNTSITSSITAIEQLKKLILDMGKENGELRDSNCELKNEMVKMKEEMFEKGQKMDALMKQNDEVAKELDKMKAEFIKNGEMSGQKADNNDKCIVVINNKLDVLDCGNELAIFQKGFALKCSGHDGWYTVRAVHPVPEIPPNAEKPSIYYYFEVTILGMRHEWLNSMGIPHWFGDIGFCDGQFPLNGKILGNLDNSFGIACKGGMKIDGKWNAFENSNGHFKSKDVVGVGFGTFKSGKENAVSLKCFASCNGKLLDILDLPECFANIRPLYPAVTLNGKGSSISVNFGQNDWAYDPMKLIH